MSARRGEIRLAEKRREPVVGRSARVFAALADPTRLRLLTRLSGGSGYSITSLTAGSRVTRQAITKHLRVLQKAGFVRGIRRGRERVFELEPRRVEEARRALEHISRKWDEALARLKGMVEE
jgi:DNA-binding transcriptional ArsR family regulator